MGTSQKNKQRKQGAARSGKQQQGEPGPLRDLRLLLKKLGREGRFTAMAAAYRAGPQRAPELFDDNGTTVVKQRVSERLSLNGPRMPGWALVQAFAELHAERLGAGPAAQLAELKTLHQAAAAEHERRSAARNAPAPRTGTEQPAAAGPAGGVLRVEREQARLREEFGWARKQMEDLRRTSAEQLKRITALEDHRAEAVRQLSLVRGQMGDMREQFEQALAEAAADNQRLDARIREVEIAAATREGALQQALQHLGEELVAQRAHGIEQDQRLTALEHSDTATREQVATVIAERDQLAQRLAEAEATAIRATAENDQLRAERDTTRRLAETHRVRQTPAPDSADSDSADHPDSGTNGQRGHARRTTRGSDGPNRLFPAKPKPGAKTLSLLGLTSVVGFAGFPLGYIAGADIAHGSTAGNIGLALVSATFSVMLLRSFSRILNPRHPVEVFGKTLALSGLYSDRYHSWNDIATIRARDTGSRLDLSLYAADGVVLDHRNSALTPEEWDAFTEAVHRSAPHIKINRPARPAATAP